MRNIDFSGKPKELLFKWALVLAYITIFYNIAEGVVSITLGMRDETLSLFGFGVDSFVEVISGIGIWHMLLRIKNFGEERRDDFEKNALRITGSAFYLLTAGLAANSIYNFFTGQKPETTFWGIIISIVSIVTMNILILFKLRVGKALNSKALIADANCTKTCLYLSVVLLIASLGYAITGISGFDPVGALLIAYFSFKEGREAFEKSRSNTQCSCDCGAD